ncbi:tetratricopeptide repeat protein [Actinoplanes sp. NPDC049802]|uniref:tetratricopeptide repeat protein n=1 Tax=Actinoplanes sp. NPDC049802 TaxID=3154742 RepID=UPI0033C25688
MSAWWRPGPAPRQSVAGSVVFGDVVQITGVGGDVTIISRQPPPYRVVPVEVRPVQVRVGQARAQPSRLLLARHQIVPFTGRQHTLKALADWSHAAEPVAARLIHATGGQGKTRLAGHVGATAAAHGWAVWQVAHTPTPVPGSGTGPGLGVDAAGESTVAVPAGALLVVVDYADRWPASALLALFAQLNGLHHTVGVRVRVLLLARSEGYWWPAVADRADSDLDIDTDQMSLPALAADSDDDRPALFATAAERFAAAMNVTGSAGGWPVPSLSGPGYGQVLAIHMAALATVDAYRHGERAPTDPAGLSAYLLRREQAYWQHLHTRTEAPVRTRPGLMHRVVFTATLTGALPRATAGQALACAGFTDTGNPTDRIIDDHTVCYPPADARMVFEPVHPDRLGEDLIALTIPGGPNTGARLARDWAPDTVTRLLTTGLPQPPVWTPAAVTVLVEAAHRWPHLAEQVLYPLIRTHPRSVIAAGGATLTRLTGIRDLDPSILEPLEPLLPDDRHIDLDIAAAAITTTLTRHRLAHTTDPAEQARLHALHAFRLANAGRHDEALAPSQQAVTIRRQLADTNPAAYLPYLAASLNNLGNRLSELGRRDEALGPSQQAVTIRRQLADANPAAHLPDLAMSLNNLGAMLSALGRRDEALAPSQEATDLYRQLAAAYLPDLATSLNNLGILLSALGRRDEALAPSQEATDLYRQLAAANPAAYLPDLAMSLNNLGILLSELGRRDEALAPSQEAVDLYRQLAAANPAAYLPDLAMSLNNLGAMLSELGRRDEALAPSQEAVTIRRQLAAANPAAYLSDLAASLNNLGILLSALGRRDEALAPSQEAVDLYRQLAAANPAAYLPDLAASLNNLGNRLSALGRRDEALAPSQEAVTIRRQLADTNPAAYLPYLAMALNNLGIWLSALGRRDEALAPSQEAVDLYRQLADANPAAYLSDLAMALNNLGILLSELGRRDEALAPSQEAVDLYRQLADANPAAYLPDLARSLWAYAWVCVNVKANYDQALESVTEAISLYKPLAERVPAVFVGQLLAAYRTLADVLDGLGRADEAADLRRQLDEMTGAEPADR